MALRRKMSTEYAAAVDPSVGRHVMMLYDDKRTRGAVMTDCINGALRNGQLAVYASVDAGSAPRMLRVSSKIEGFSESVERGNLLVVDLSPVYRQVLAGNLDLLRDLRAKIEELVKERQAAGKKDEAIIVGDCADRLAVNERFAECMNVEGWWQDTCRDWQRNGLKITVVCLHPGPMLDKNNKHRISSQHDSTVTARAGRA
jgi:hypothetical protein